LPPIAAQEVEMPAVPQEAESADVATAVEQIVEPTAADVQVAGGHVVDENIEPVATAPAAIDPQPGDADAGAIEPASEVVTAAAVSNATPTATPTAAPGLFDMLPATVQPDPDPAAEAAQAVTHASNDADSPEDEAARNA
jgi:hypothetical protein